MNCDQAFDAMTDPNGPDSAELWRHLSGCPRCRQMYETLEPAMGLFAASDTPPRERPFASDVRSAALPLPMAQRIARQLSLSGTASRGAPPRRRLWGAVLAAAVAGFLLSVGLDSLRLSPPSPGAAVDCPWLYRESAAVEEPASLVTARCVACHLSQPAASAGDQSGALNFRHDWDRFVSAWQTRIGSPAFDPCMIAAHVPPAGAPDRGLPCHTAGLGGRSPRHV
jgi:hypothetical protein